MEDYHQNYLIDYYSNLFKFEIDEKQKNSILVAYELGISLFGEDKIDFEKLVEVSIHNFKLDKKYPYLNLVDPIYNKIRQN